MQNEYSWKPYSSSTLSQIEILNRTDLFQSVERGLKEVRRLLTDYPIWFEKTFEASYQDYSRFW